MSLVIDGVTKSYGSYVAVSDLRFTVPEGQVFGLLGLNGAGKSTTIRILRTTIESVQSIVGNRFTVDKRHDYILVPTAVIDAPVLLQRLIAHGADIQHFEMVRPTLNDVFLRIVEMRLVTCKPSEIMTGKIVGIGLVGLVQYFIWLIGAGASLYLRHQTSGLTISQVPPATLIVLPVFYILGYFLYASLYAIAGSLVYRQEDQQMAVTPVAMIMLILFYVSIFGVLPRPDSLFSVIVSYVPLFTPPTMFARAALVGVPVWEILISIALTLVFNTALVLYGARVYRRFALRTSGQSGWRLLFQKKHVTHSPT